MVARLAVAQLVGTSHPVFVFLAQPRQVFERAAHAVGFEQLHHQREHRRLRAAEVVGAIAVGHVAAGVDQPGEVVGHGGQQIVPAARGQTEHDEVRVPVVKLAEAPAGDDIRMRQRQQRGVGRMLRRMPGEHVPQAVDVRAQGLPGWRDVVAGVHAWHVEVPLDERAKVELRLLALAAVSGQDRFRIAARHAVDEGLAVVEHALHLHRAKQFLVAIGRGERVRLGHRRGARFVGESDRIAHCSE
jgi:hypothetical protein